MASRFASAIYTAVGTEEPREVEEGFAKRYNNSATTLALPKSDSDIDFSYVQFDRDVAFGDIFQALGFAQSTRVGQCRVDRVNKRPELRRLSFDIDPHTELAERGAAHRADRSDERSAKTLFN